MEELILDPSTGYLCFSILNTMRGGVDWVVEGGGGGRRARLVGY